MSNDSERIARLESEVAQLRKELTLLKSVSVESIERMLAMVNAVADEQQEMVNKTAAGVTDHMRDLNNAMLSMMSDTRELVQEAQAHISREFAAMREFRTGLDDDASSTKIKIN